MKILSLIRRFGQRTPLSTNAPVMVATVPTLELDDYDPAVALVALETLDEQMHDVVDRNADGVNLMALKIRRESDLLLTLGISDPFAAKAGSLAQKALELSNARRGLTLQAVKHDVTVQERAMFVSQSIALVERATMLLAAAKKNNRANIDLALSQQARLMGDMHRSISSIPSLS